MRTCCPFGIRAFATLDAWQDFVKILITKHLSPICEFMLVSLSDADEGVGLAATEFFFSLFSSTMVNEQRRKLVTSSFNLLQVSERASERA